MGALEQARTIEERLEVVEREVKRIKSIQQRSLPQFKEAMARITTMRETLHAHGNSLMKVEKIVSDGAAANAATAVSIQELVKVLQTAKTAGGFLRRYWPRMATALIGIAVGKGWLTLEDGKSISGIFGF